MREQLAPALAHRSRSGANHSCLRLPPPSNGDIVDEPRLAETRRGQKPDRPLARRRGRGQTLRLARLDVIDDESAPLDACSRGGQGLCDRPARANLFGAKAQRRIKRRRRLAFLRRQIDVAGGEREAVRLAKGRRADDLDAKIEVARDAGDDFQLLIILFAEDRDVRPALIDKLGDDCRDAREMGRPEAVLRPAAAGPLTCSMVAKPWPYMASTLGAKTASPPAAENISTSASNVRG